VPKATPNPCRLLQFCHLRPSKELPPADLRLVRRHLTFGWWSIAAFATFGLALETLHGFKVSAYLDVTNATRRLMWTLAHAHGTLLGLAHLGLAASVRLAVPEPARLETASKALVAASLVLPGGFFLGGVSFYAGDPGVGVALVPVGAALMIYTAVALARAVSSRSDS
jgi:hypothetical protein